MQIYDKKFLIFYCIIGLLFIFANFVIYDYIELPGAHEPITIKNKINFEINQVYSIMTNIQEYPKIFPKNVISVEIINRTENIIFAKEELKIKGNKGVFTVKHTLEKNKSHVIEIFNGDVKSTKIIQLFNQDGDSTEIITKIDLKLVFKRYSWAGADSIVSEKSIGNTLDNIYNIFENALSSNENSQNIKSK